jgi:hypothetical protein
MNASTSAPTAVEATYGRLRYLNLAAGCLHLVQGVLMMILSTSFRLPVTDSFVVYDPEAGKLVPKLEELFQLRLGMLVAAFLLMSAAAHFTISLPSIYEWYVRNLKRGINYARWIEYSFSASLMIVIIAMLVGMYDGVSLMMIFTLNAMMILFGWMMELHNQTTIRTNWTAFWFGCIAGAVPWIAIALYLFGSGGEGGGPPGFVYGIFFSIFVFFNIFAVNMVLQYKKVGPWRDYLYGERMYIILSLVAKSLLAWQVWAGTLRPV